jgi:hypothetical protein
LRAQDTHEYKQAFARLRDLKPQIEQLQALLQRSHVESHHAAPAAAQDTGQLPAPAVAAAAAAAASTDPSEVQDHHSSPVSIEQPGQAAAGDQPLQTTSVQLAPGQQPAVVDGTAVPQQTASVAPFALPDGANGSR